LFVTSVDTDGVLEMETDENDGKAIVEIMFLLFARFVPADTVVPDTDELIAVSVYSLLQASVFADGALAMLTLVKLGVFEAFNVFPAFEICLPALIAEPDDTNASTYDLFVASVLLETVPVIVNELTDGLADNENVFPDFDKPEPAEILDTWLSTYDLLVTLLTVVGAAVMLTELSEISLFILIVFEDFVKLLPASVVWLSTYAFVEASWADVGSARLFIL